MIYSRQTAEIFLEGLRANIIEIYKRVRQGWPLPPILFNITTEYLARAVRAKDVKGFPKTNLIENYVTCGRHNLLNNWSGKFDENINDFDG